MRNNMEALGNKPHLDETLLDALKGIPNYWLSAGTALGLYRDGDFIPSDTDIDIEMWVDDEYKLPERFSRYVVQDSKGMKGQRAYIDTRNNVIFDIYFYEKKGDMAVSPLHSRLKFPAKWFENKKKLPTKYGELYFPNPIEEYLEHRYGKLWQTPANKKGLYNGQF
jgi:phosphorylcholine metabolism protein LicD